MKGKFFESFIGFKATKMDVKLLQDLSQSLEVPYSDVMRLALWDFATSPSNGLLKESLKEMARQRKKEFELDMLKEMEYINNKNAFFIDGFRSMLNNYSKKHVPLPYVKRYVTIKIIGLYKLFESHYRQEYLKYVEEHFMHYFPSQKSWFVSQLKLIRNMKKGEKDELLSKFKEIKRIDRNDDVSKGDMFKVQALDKDIQS